MSTTTASSTLDPIELFNKHKAILREIVVPHLPQYRDRLDELLANHRHYNIEHLVEVAMCHLGGYTFVDQDKHDNSDYSDTKTGSIRTHDSYATITRVASGTVDQPHTKDGDLRVVLHCQFTDSLHYYFMPRAYWDLLREHSDNHFRSLRARYHAAIDTIPRWQSYRVASFRDLALMPSTVTVPGQFVPVDCPRNTLFEWAD